MQLSKQSQVFSNKNWSLGYFKRSMVWYNFKGRSASWVYFFFRKKHVTDQGPTSRSDFRPGQPGTARWRSSPPLSSRHSGALPPGPDGRPAVRVAGRRPAGKRLVVDCPQGRRRSPWRLLLLSPPHHPPQHGRQRPGGQGLAKDAPGADSGLQSRQQHGDTAGCRHSHPRHDMWVQTIFILIP